MKDPYQVLGVSPTASDDEIKKAYRELARKYHPDNYQDNPLADLAQEKMKEVNEAYDTLTKSRSGGGTRARTADSSYSSAGTASSDPRYAQVRSAINSGYLNQAEELLRAMPDRDAQWNYLMGAVAFRRGHLDNARAYYETACRMDPTNREYQQAYSRMQTGGAYQAYRQTGYPENTQCDGCDVCTSLMCADCFCRCLGSGC